MLQSKLAAALSLAVAAAVFTPTEASSRPLTPREIYKKFAKSVVLVFASDGSAQGSAGTGSIISTDGQIITNAHVVMTDGRPYKYLYVYTKPKKLTGSMSRDLKKRYKVTLVASDKRLDLALLKMDDPPSNLQAIDFADPDQVEIGEPVVAIGMPETGGLWTLTTGSISSVVADFNRVRGKDVFQTEASVNRGNSGGPLLNAFGHMVGINTSISRRAADGLAITDINFSLKSSVAVDWLKRRDLMTLAYADPKQSEVGAIAAVEPPKTTRKPKTYTVDGGDGKTQVVVVKPSRGQEVADDPDFMAAAQASNVVNRKVDGQPKKKAEKPKKVKPKLLTKARPYELDDFVEKRIREIKELENDMFDARSRINERRRRGRFW